MTRTRRRHALTLTVDHMVPGRAATLRPHTRKELAATSVLAVPALEASMKLRAEGPVDEPSDVAAGVWGGVIPRTPGPPARRSRATTPTTTCPPTSCARAATCSRLSA